MLNSNFIVLPKYLILTPEHLFLQTIPIVFKCSEFLCIFNLASAYVDITSLLAVAQVVAHLLAGRLVV